MDVLVTGGAGFVGSHVAEALAERHDVRVLDSLESGRRANVPDEASFYEGDLRDRALVERATAGVDAIVHEAALVSVERSIAMPVESHDVNLAGTLGLLEAARDQDARVVLASSAAIYGQPEAVPIDESHPTEPTSPYGLEKLALDHYGRLYHELYGLETVLLRYFNVYGPRQTGGDYAGVVSTFVEQALADDPITVHGDGEQTRDFVYVDDVVAATRLALETDAVGTAFNVGTGDSITIRRLAALVRDVADADSEIEHVDARSGDVRQSCADVSRARRRLGFDPACDVREGLEATVDWFRSGER